MERSRRSRIVVLIVLLGVLVWVLFLRTVSPPAGSARATSNERGARRTSASGAAAVTAPDVRLEALPAERPKPGQTTRNLFRFKPAPPPPAPSPTQPAAAVAPVPTGPPAPPPLPPIALKLTGTGSQGNG